MLHVTTLYRRKKVMAVKQTLLTDCCIPRAKKSRSDDANASELSQLASCGEREQQTSSYTTKDLVADASALDYTDIAADMPRLEADTSSSDFQGADTPTPEVSDECDEECCKEGYTGKPFQARGKSVILSTGKLQRRKVLHFSTDWYEIYPWLTLYVKTSKAFATSVDIASKMVCC